MSRPRFLALLLLVFIPRPALPQGVPLGPEFRVNTYTTSFQYGASVAADASGNFVVVWTSDGQDGSNQGIFGQRYSSSGAPLGPEFGVNTFTTLVQVVPSVAADASGNFVVVWQQGLAGSGGSIFGQRYSSSGAPLGPEFQVNTYTTSYQNRASVAADTSGNFVVVWESNTQDGSSWGIFGQRYSSSGAPLGPEFRVNTYTTSSQNRPSAAAGASGNFVVVWESIAQDGSGRGIFGQRYSSSGAPLGPEFRVNTYTTSYQFDASVAADASGNFVVVWNSAAQPGLAYDIFGQRFASTGAPLGPEFRVNTYTTGEQRRGFVGADTSGNFVVVWHNSSAQDGSYWGSFGQRYASTGAPLGPEFRVNTYTTGNQVQPSIAADASGSFVVVWQSAGQDGSSYGVFGQRYGRIVPVELTGFSAE